MFALIQLSTIFVSLCCNWSTFTKLLNYIVTFRICIQYFGCIEMRLIYLSNIHWLSNRELWNKRSRLTWISEFIWIFPILEIIDKFFIWSLICWYWSDWNLIVGSVIFSFISFQNFLLLSIKQVFLLSWKRISRK